MQCGTGEDGSLIKSPATSAVRLRERTLNIAMSVSSGNKSHWETSMLNTRIELQSPCSTACYTHDRLCSLTLREDYSAVVGVFKTRLPCRIFRHHTEITGGWKQAYTISTLCLIQVRRLMKRVMGWTYNMQRGNSKSNKTVVGMPEQERTQRIN
jgi:hypothetical protein